MDQLRDIIGYDLKILFCGDAPGKGSASKGMYYADARNRFWAILAETMLTPVLLDPADADRLLRFGIGLTDLSKTPRDNDKNVRPSEKEIVQLRGRVKKYAPKILAFNGKGTAEAVLGNVTNFGHYPQTLESSLVFVLPSTSGANQRHWDSRHWYDLARACRQTEVGMDVSTRRIVRRSLGKRLGDLELFLKVLAEEISWWFRLQDTLDYPESLNLCKPICIELFEYATALVLLYDAEQETARQLTQFWTSKGRPIEVPVPEVALREAIVQSSTRLKPARDCIAAHRYTGPRGKKPGWPEFLPLREMMRAHGLMSSDCLRTEWKNLATTHKALTMWYHQHVDRNLSAIADFFSCGSE